MRTILKAIGLSPVLVVGLFAVSLGWEYVKSQRSAALVHSWVMANTKSCAYVSTSMQQDRGVMFTISLLESSTPDTVDGVRTPHHTKEAIMLFFYEYCRQYPTATFQ